LVSEAAAPSPACAALASASARDSTSVRCAISFALAGGVTVLAFWSGASTLAPRSPRVVPPQVGQTCSASFSGHLPSSGWLCGDVRPQSAQWYGTSTDQTEMFRASPKLSAAMVRNDSLTSTSV